MNAAQGRNRRNWRFLCCCRASNSLESQAYGRIAYNVRVAIDVYRFFSDWEGRNLGRVAFYMREVGMHEALAWN